MGADACRARGPFWEEGNGLLTFECPRDRECLVLGALHMAAFHIDRGILIGEPVDERVAELILGNEPATSGAAQDKDIEPADVI